MFPTTRSCDCVIALNKKIEEEFVASGFAKEKIVNMPNGVIIPQRQIKPNDSNKKKLSETRILYAGRLHPQKGPDVLIESLKLISQERSDLNWHLDILGKGVLLDQLKSRVEAYGISNRVSFRGAVENVDDYMQQADIFVLPSRAEGMSNAILEAMAMGIPIVASNIPGNDGLIVNEIDGLVTKPEDPSGLSRAIIRLIEDEHLRNKLGKEARKKAIEKYSMESVAKSYYHLYNDLLCHTA